MNKNISSTLGVCVENDLLKYYSESLTVSNCSSYSWDDSSKSLTCKKCLNGFFLFEKKDAADNKSLKQCLTWS